MIWQRNLEQAIAVQPLSEQLQMGGEGEALARRPIVRPFNFSTALCLHPSRQISGAGKIQ
jgi:hypothetical protein